MFNNLYTQSAWFNPEGKREALDRSTYFTALTGIYFGITPRVNIGLDINPSSVHLGPKSSNPLKVLVFRNTDTSRVALASLGPKVRFTPIPSEPGFTIQSSLWIPIGRDLDGINSGRPFLAFDRFQWWFSFYYTRNISRDRFQIFAAVEIVPRIDRRFKWQKDFASAEPNLGSDVIIFNKVLFSWFPEKRFTLYGSLEAAPFIEPYDGGAWGYFFATGLGGKYILKNRFFVDVLYTRFLVGNNSGAGQTFNLGFSYLFQGW